MKVTIFFVPSSEKENVKNSPQKRVDNKAQISGKFCVNKKKKKSEQKKNNRNTKKIKKKNAGSTSGILNKRFLTVSI